ncbi:MAG: lactate utilization protein [Oscillospiraceae bacterium]|nr:lactate utilization protein [Oscillospiraceae bacterium]
MPNLELLQKNLESCGYAVTRFATGKQAADYLNAQLDGTTVAFGGSTTLADLGLYESLSTHNTVFWHWKGNAPADATNAEIYISSVNGVAETGELINIDGVCNRVSETLFGHKKVYFVVGANKVAPDYDAALYRARNVAAPLNARRLNKNTPCAQGELRCYNCNSPERICNALTVLWRKPGGASYEVILVDEALGY